MIENEAMVKEYHLSEKCLVLCTCAESTLMAVCGRISDGSVTPGELSLVKKKKNHVLKLIDAAIEDKDVSKRLEEALETRLKENKGFCEEKERLVQLFNCVSINIQGILMTLVLHNVISRNVRARRGHF